MDEKKLRRQKHWERNWRKWYLLYFYLGVGFNFILYFTKPYGFDPGRSLFLGCLFGIGVPICTMFLGGIIHRRLWGL
ncbi:MAG: hypothetical protein WHS38_06945 [Thermodesulforhabdaceae bacterium]